MTHTLNTLWKSTLRAKKVLSNAIESQERVGLETDTLYSELDKVERMLLVLQSTK